MRRRARRAAAKAIAILEWDLGILRAEDPFYRWPEDPQFSSLGPRLPM